MKSMKN